MYANVNQTACCKIHGVLLRKTPKIKAACRFDYSPKILFFTVDELNF